ncbi:hypothetical protein ACIKTA_07010, partial [Hansschlegelia beijingensis]
MLAPGARAEYRPGTIISEPADQRGSAITRPAGKPDREWRRGRKTPELRRTPQRPIAGPAAPPRFDMKEAGVPPSFEEMKEALDLKS